MKQLKYIPGLFLIMVLGTGLSFASNPTYDGVITGQILDGQTQSPIEYATIAVYSEEDSTLLSGTITNGEGRFSMEKLPRGSYYVVVNFLGYEEESYDGLMIHRPGMNIDLGALYLETSSQFLEEVVVTNERNSIDFQIDKKVVSVGEQMTAASLSAVEVLENVPSIRVDIEGNVSLRGSTGFTVLVDGKPTVLEPSEVLRQTPASTIENIEIITNPSSRYQPDGTGGIINIITKKNRMLGLQGLFNLKAGTFGNYGGDFLLNYRMNKVNFFVGADYRYGPRPGTMYSERRTTQNDTTTIIQSEGDMEWKRKGGGVRLGMDWDLSPRDNLSIGFRTGKFGHSNQSELDYFTFYEPFAGESREISLDEGARGGNYYNLNTSFTHKFRTEGQELMMQYNQRLYQGTEFSENILMNEDGTVNQGSRTTEDGPSRRMEFKLDYTQPLGEKNGMEAGFQFRNGKSSDATALYDYHVETEEFVLRPESNNISDYSRRIYALYGIMKGELGGFGYQAGLRGEYTDRTVTSPELIEDQSMERFDFFPTLHLSYRISEKDQVMASYSRRIDRPRGYYLEPFLTWYDMYNVRRGNPALDPEYIDALEMGYIHSREKSQLSIEAYYRVKHNKVERTQQIYSEGVILHTFENVGTDYSLGMEALYNVSLWPWWEVNLMGDFYDYRIDSEQNGDPYQFQSFNWGTRLNNTFSLGKIFRLQLDASYNSATITTQGRDEGYYRVNAALRSDLLDRKLSLVLQVRDVFGSVERVSITEDFDFYNYTRRESRAPVVSLTASYRLNNFRQKGAGGGMNAGGDDF